MALHQGCINFSKIQKPSQNPRHQDGDKKRVPYLGPTNIRCHHKKSIVTMMCWCLGFVHPHHSCTLTFISSDNRLSSFLMPVHGFHRLIITGVLADRKPVDLHMFRNYQSPSSVLGLAQRGVFKPTCDPEEQLIWRAARATGAAPSYFR